MKKNLLLLTVMLFAFANSYCQATFSTGAMNVDVSEYGRIQLYTPDGIQQLERASILVGTSATDVFDYTNDAEQLDPSVLVASPLLSDYEIYGSIDNSYSALPPAVSVKINAYGWNDAAYAIFKFNVKNDEASAITASIGMDIIPYLNEEYGFDSVTYNNAEGVIRFHRGTQENMGAKLLSSSLSSLYSFEWYDGYTVDADYWNWMNMGSLQPEYVSTTVDGPVSITSQAPATIAPGESFDVYYALALGVNEQTMQSNIAAAVQKYQILTTSIDEKQLSVNEFKNFPNPFKSSTTIGYQLPGNGFVSLKIYDALGNEKATLVNSNQTSGSHTIDFNAKDLTSGVYSYRLRYNDQVISNRMLMIK
ncbi:MAG: T9SS type A sorting domain-containing protein [Bacteroidales bacterium]